MSRFERRKSTAASWCIHLATFAVPYFLIIILGHKFGWVDTKTVFWLIGLGILILVASIFFGLRGFFELWTEGYEGGLKSARGVAISTVLLLPFIYHGLLAVTLPPLFDISTDLDDPPTYENVLSDRDNARNTTTESTEIQKELQLRAYPKIAARRYPLGSGRVFSEVIALVVDRDWTILASDTAPGTARIDDESSGLVAKPTTDAQGRPLRLIIPTPRPKSGPTVRPQDIEAISVSPIGRSSSEGTDAESDSEPNDERYIEAVATSLLFGFQTDVVIRIVEEEDSTLVDMRSSSRYASHDLGANARQIINFMNDLDTALQGLSSS